MTEPTSSRMINVAGYCPMGCGRTLFLDDEGHVLCSFIECPDRLSTDAILADRETEHVVEFRPDTFIIRHPLRERLDDALMTCALHAHVESLDGPPVQLGRYRARGQGSAWTWEPLALFREDHAPMTLDECRAAVGLPVVYTPYGPEPPETGVITSTGHLYAFVRYGTDEHSKATAPERLHLERTDQ